MGRCPLLDEATSGLRTNCSGHHLSVEVKFRLLPLVIGMEMRRFMLPVEHTDHDAKERRDDRHEQVYSGTQLPGGGLTTTHWAAFWIFNAGHFKHSFLRALRDGERLEGADHPDTLKSVNNLAYVYERQGRDQQTEPLYLRALEARERMLGADHPETLSSVNNLADLYLKQGRYGEAEPLYLRALRGAKRILGESHPHTKVLQENWERCHETRKSGRSLGT